jgi:hypothetical protein
MSGLLWRAAHEAALANLPRALAAMGFDRTHGPMPRGGVPGFEPVYVRHRPWARRYAAPAPAIAAVWDAAARAEAAKLNREKLYWPVRLCIRERDKLAAYVCAVTGDWRTIAGGAWGDDLAHLAAMAWGQPYTKAAFRLARISGLEVIPNAA